MLSLTNTTCETHRESGSPTPSPAPVKAKCNIHRAKARTGKMKTPMDKIKRLVTLGTPSWACHPGNQSSPAVEFCASKRGPNKVCDQEDCSYHSW